MKYSITIFFLLIYNLIEFYYKLKYSTNYNIEIEYKNNMF